MLACWNVAAASWAVRWLCCCSASSISSTSAERTSMVVACMEAVFGRDGRSALDMIMPEHSGGGRALRGCWAQAWGVRGEQDGGHRRPR